MEELRLFALEGMTDELKRPSDQKDGEAISPERMGEDAGYEKSQREHNQRDSEAMAGAVDGMPMAAGILVNPLFAGAVAKHAQR